MNTQENTTFDTGKSYTYGFICDSSLRVKITVVRRTEKSIWFTQRNDKEVKMARISVYRNCEQFAPDGTGYSMYPVCRADKPAKETLIVNLSQQEAPVVPVKLKPAFETMGIW